MTAALYARVSTRDQDCAMQLAELRAYCAARGWTPVEYVDTGWSGAKVNRPEQLRLMRDAVARRVDVVLVWKLDRWARSLSHTIATLQDLTAAGVRFVAITQGIDTDQANPMARFLLQIMAAFAEMERELIRERVASGMRSAQANGTRTGRPIGRPRRVLDRRKIEDLRESGKSFSEIARVLKLPRSTVFRASRD
jgi:putative DNA-invertase from lambdoid prophage Rac